MEEGFIASQSRWQSIIVGKARQQDPAACGHIASTGKSRKQVSYRCLQCPALSVHSYTIQDALPGMDAHTHTQPANLHSPLLRLLSQGNLDLYLVDK